MFAPIVSEIFHFVTILLNKLSCSPILIQDNYNRIAFISTEHSFILFFFLESFYDTLTKIRESTGVKRALVVGCGLQAFQQLSAINTVM